MSVDLGFIEKTDSWHLLSHFFPSKVGGKPAWLALNNIPSAVDVKCEFCEKSCVFLSQIYSPVNEKDTCFHRSIFVFICKDATCCKLNDNKNLKVFRSQLAKVNDCYSAEPPSEDGFKLSDPHPHAGQYQDLCSVCGGAAPKRCARCHTAAYCGKEHQTIDWKTGHKAACKQMGSADTGQPLAIQTTHPYLFPEYELVMEREEEQDAADTTSEDKLNDYKECLKSSEASSMAKDDLTGKDLEEMAAGQEKEDKQFNKFRKTIEKDPEQVLRYNRGGQPVWVSSESVPTEEDIPKCQCGASRQFEFQILPQLLNHLNVDSVEGSSIDWGTLAVYTCRESCDTGAPYHQEFIWKQDFSPDSLSSTK